MHRVYTYGWKGWQSFSLLLLRLIAGTAFILHGWPKIQHPTSWMNAMGGGASPILQAAAALAEFGGGIALILGLLTPIAAAALVVDMVFALSMVHIPKGDVFVGQPGHSFELPLLYVGVMTVLLFVGPGRFSIDAALWKPRYLMVHERELPSIGRAA
jgi:putative oxidoreductase